MLSGAVVYIFRFVLFYWVTQLRSQAISDTVYSIAIAA